MGQAVAHLAHRTPDFGIGDCPKFLQPIDHVANRERFDFLASKQEQSPKQSTFDLLVELFEQSQEALNADGIVFG